MRLFLSLSTCHPLVIDVTIHNSIDHGRRDLLRFLDDPFRVGADLVEDFVRSDEKLSVKPDQVGNDVGLNNNTS